jgi:hypothetical protein
VFAIAAANLSFAKPVSLPDGWIDLRRWWSSRVARMFWTSFRLHYLHSNSNSPSKRKVIDKFSESVSSSIFVFVNSIKEERELASDGRTVRFNEATNGDCSSGSS